MCNYTGITNHSTCTDCLSLNCDYVGKSTNKNGDLRLQTSGSHNLLQISYNSTWKNVCGNEFYEIEALVACR